MKFHLEFIYKRNKLGKPQIFVLYTFTFFAMVNFSNTLAAIDTNYGPLQPTLHMSAKDCLKYLIYNINPEKKRESVRTSTQIGDRRSQQLFLILL